MNVFREAWRQLQRLPRKIRKHFRNTILGIAVPIRLRKSLIRGGYLAVVAVFRDEGPYLKEWLEFHLKAGVDHFFLFDNGSVDNGREVLAAYPSKVTVRDWDGSQPGAYQRAVIDYGFRYRWMMFIDIDEFVFPSTVASLGEVLRGLESEDLVLLPWRVFGTGGLDDRNRTSSVVRTFRRSINYRSENLPSRASKVKAIANPGAIRRAGTHWPEMRRGSRPAVWSNGEARTDKANMYGESQQILLHHYVSKSRAEFEEKKSRNRRNLMGSRYDPNSNDKVVALADSRESGVKNISAVQFLDNESPWV
jgi:hypothetical protein